MKRRRTQSADERMRQIQWWALEWFRDHELLSEEYWDHGRGARWLFGKRDTFVHKLEIIAGIGGTILVHGDWKPVCFAHYSDHPDAFHRLCWMGLCTDVGYYVAQKATIGADRASVYTFDDDVAEHELRTEIRFHTREARHSRESSQFELGTARKLRRALTLFREHGWDARALAEHLYTHVPDICDPGPQDFGIVLESHVIIAHIACHRLVHLLRERHGPEGPVQCRARSFVENWTQPSARGAP